MKGTVFLEENMIGSRGFMDDLFRPYVDIDELRRSQRSLSRKHERTVKNLKSHLGEMEDWLGELALLNQTMLRLLLEKKAFSREELGRAMDEIDLIDGVRDGKVARTDDEPEKKKKKAPAKKRKAVRRKKR